MEQKPIHTVFITGASGLIGMETLRRLLEPQETIGVRILVRDSKKNRKKLREFIKNPRLSVVWGDLRDPEAVKRGLGDADVVLHLGGMVPPVADKYPELTLKTNVEGTRNVVRAIQSRPDSAEVKLLYMGSVAQFSFHEEPGHWGRCGDPQATAVFDHYGLSKIRAELEITESGLPRWVSMRQSGVLHAGLLQNGLNPISFTVPLRGVLEWTTLEDTATLLVNFCRTAHELPEEFWRRFYSISSGPAYRLWNYQFEELILSSLGLPGVEKVFSARWFAVRNFHGCWFTDSQALEDYFHFRANIPPRDYFREMAKKMPPYFRLAGLVPAPVIRAVMKHVGSQPGAMLNWLEHDDHEEMVRAFFGSREAYDSLPDWEGFDSTPPSAVPTTISHGYDEEKPLGELGIEDMCQAAEFRGGSCLDKAMTPGDLDTQLTWRCAEGHKFRLSPRAVLLGGHWCPDCLPEPWRYASQSKSNRFLAQVWLNAHRPDEEDY